MDKKQFIKLVLEKRFGEATPEDIPCLLEINTFTPVGESESPIGMGVQLVIDGKQNIIKEDYQVSPEGVVYSWGNTPIIDEKSLNTKL
jgi:hypothetical protein